MEINSGIDKLLKKLSKIYFNRDVLKYTLPEEITRNKIKDITQNLISTMNSLVGCCSLGTGHLDSFINDIYGNLRLSPLLQNDSRS